MQIKFPSMHMQNFSLQKKTTGNSGKSNLIHIQPTKVTNSNSYQIKLGSFSVYKRASSAFHR